MVLLTVVLTGEVSAQPKVEEYPPELVDNVVNNVVFINVDLNGSDKKVIGFGFVVGEKDGVYFAATTRHTLYDRNLRGVPHDGLITIDTFSDQLTADVPAYEVRLTDAGTQLASNLDLVFLRFTPKKPFYFKRKVLSKDSSEVLPGNSLSLIGYLTQENVPIWNIDPIQSKIFNLTEFKENSGETQINFASIRKFGPGHSGAPVVSPNGIVAIFQASNGGNSIALSIDAVKKLAESEKMIPWQLQAADPAWFSKAGNSSRPSSGLMKWGIAIGAVVVGALVASSQGGSSGEGEVSNTLTLTVPTP